MSSVRREVHKVLRADACSGCGLCPLLDRGLSMQLDEGGFMRPLEVGPADERADAVRIFRASCPGRRVNAVTPSGSTRHPLLGAYFGMWEAWAADDEIRFQGSSGGALTAIHTWLLESGAAVQVSGAAADPARPTRTVPVRIQSRDEALRAAGSRYAPVAVAQSAVFASDQAMTAKPCEVAAVRAMTDADRALQAPILLSFFCAGTPSQRATERLIRERGGPEPEAITDMWYRGRGWPGRFTAVFDGGSVSADYDESWGAVLGPSTQWRCKVCPDGIGESADIAAADSWDSDESGYPTFEDGDGRSALIARTERGLALVLAAEQAGILRLRPLDPEQLVAAQPLQVSRRRFLAARLLGARLAGRPVPRYRGFGLLRLQLPHPRLAIRTARGTYRRVRAAVRAARTERAGGAKG